MRGGSREPAPEGGDGRGGGGASSPDGRFTVTAEAVVFGLPNTPVELRVRRRDTSWRAGGAARTLAVFVVIAPFTALVPPHAPWLIGSLAAGVILARRRWTERFTLERADGACPKCGAPLRVKSGRLRLPHPVACDACHHQTALRFPEDALHGPAGAAD